MANVDDIVRGLTINERHLFRCLTHGWACYGNPCPRCRRQSKSTGSPQADFAIRLQIERAIVNLSARHAGLISAIELTQE